MYAGMRMHLNRRHARFASGEQDRRDRGDPER